MQRGMSGTVANGDQSLTRRATIAEKILFLVGSCLFSRSTIVCLSMNGHGVRKSSHSVAK
jgi:hypothetical protein